MREITAAPGFNLPARSEKQIASNVLKGSLGNLIEWFDWYVYASFAIYFSGAFFPAGNQTAQLLASAGVFAIGFFMRPLGSLVMGRLADRLDRFGPDHGSRLIDHHSRPDLRHDWDLVTSHLNRHPLAPRSFARRRIRHLGHLPVRNG